MSLKAHLRVAPRAACVAAVTLGGLAFAPPATEALEIGDPAPAFELPKLFQEDDTAPDTLLAAGGPALLVFWNTACPDCLADVVELSERATRAPDVIRIVGICTDSERVSDARRFARGVQLGFPNLWDESGVVAAAYDARDVSFALALIDERSQIVALHHDHPESISELLDTLWERAAHLGEGADE